jgi:hypothetical protein
MAPDWSDWSDWAWALSCTRPESQDTRRSSAIAGPENPGHVILDCPHEAERRIGHEEAQGGQLDFASRLDTPKGAKLASR